LLSESHLKTPFEHNTPATGNRDRLPRVVISLDVELRWGLRDHLRDDIDAYRENLEGSRQAIPALLKMFDDYGIRATWACVGALGCSGWQEYFQRAPQMSSSIDAQFHVDHDYSNLDPDGHLHFAPDLLKQISESHGQRLGTHSFSHVPLIDSGANADFVKNDMQAVCNLWSERFGGAPQSLVFPKNQVAFLDVIRTTPIRIWRGPERSSIPAIQRHLDISLLGRAIRIGAGLNPYLNHSTGLDQDATPTMTRASLFLRTNLPSPLWKLHFSRVKREIEQLGHGEIFHLWWHPHNLGKHITLRLARVEKVLELINLRADRSLLLSSNMEDLVS